jgi:hypothetical protein
MKLPNFKRLYDQDYKDDFKDLVRQLALSLNSGIELLYEALNKKITLRDNIACTVKDLKIVVDSTGIPVADVIFTLDSTGVNMDGCQVIKITNEKNPTKYPTSGVNITYNQTANGVQIKHVTGLIAGETYTLRVVAYHQ